MNMSAFFENSVPCPFDLWVAFTTSVSSSAFLCGEYNTTRGPFGRSVFQPRTVSTIVGGFILRHAERSAFRRDSGVGGHFRGDVGVGSCFRGDAGGTTCFRGDAGGVPRFGGDVGACSRLLLKLTMLAIFSGLSSGALLLIGLRLS